VPPCEAARGGEELYDEKEADSEAATTDDEAGRCLCGLRCGRPQQSAEEAFERGREVGAELVISLVPEALSEMERSARAQCLQECSDDVQRRAQDAELARLHGSPWFSDGGRYWSWAPQPPTSYFYDGGGVPRPQGSPARVGGGGHLVFNLRLDDGPTWTSRDAQW
jgi:hypothetical protein